MWAYYANNHKGFCTEYDFSSINSICEFGCIPVQYSNSYYQYQFDRNDGAKRLLGVIYTKANSWKCENEWRVVETSKEYGIQGYGKECESPLKIYIGCKAMEQLIIDLKEVCQEKNIELFKAELIPGSYDMCFNKIL